MSAIDLVVAIPTFNRGELVETAVRSLMTQANQGPRWRVLAVDNNSRDDTALRLASLAAQWPRLTCLMEPEPGSSKARNCAIKAANSRYILFTDDECKFPERYIDQALAIIDTRRPVMFGGPVLPWYREEPPAWFRDDYGSYSLPHGAGRADRISLSGANLGFDLETLRKTGGFDTRLGVHGAAKGFGEETDLELRMIEHFGLEAVWYDPEFHNFHLVLPAKYQWPDLLTEHLKRGIARARVSRNGRRAQQVSSGVMPDCLRPWAAPRTPAAPLRWQNVAYDWGLPAVRGVGYVLGRSRFFGSQIF